MLRDFRLNRNDVVVGQQLLGCVLWKMVSCYWALEWTLQCIAVKLLAWLCSLEYANKWTNISLDHSCTPPRLETWAGTEWTLGSQPVNFTCHHEIRKLIIQCHYQFHAVCPVYKTFMFCNQKRSKCCWNCFLTCRSWTNELLHILSWRGRLAGLIPCQMQRH